jgi:hypothetical protein
MNNENEILKERKKEKRKIGGKREGEMGGRPRQGEKRKVRKENESWKRKMNQSEI